MDLSYAPVHEALHQQAASLLASTGNALEDTSAVDSTLAGLVSASHLNHDALSLALMHVGSHVTAATLQSYSHSGLLRAMRAAVGSAAQQRGTSPLAVVAQLSQRYLTLCTAESAAIGMFDGSVVLSGAASGISGADGPGAGSQTSAHASAEVLAAPVMIRRGLGVATLRGMAHPGVQMLQHTQAPVEDKRWHVSALLQAAAAAAGPVMLRWPLGMLTAADVPLSAACSAVARAVVVGVPSGPFPMPPTVQQAQVRPH